ncbi:MAG TPA: HAMP domain-containing sensor histidine kinase [Streptosporangiaceae bacterium]
MTRRILLALLALIVAVVVGAMVPLGLDATGHDRTSFTDETDSTVRTYAAVFAPTLMTGGTNNVALNRVYKEVRLAGDRLEVMQIGRIYPRVDIGMPAGAWGQIATAAEQERLAAAAEPISTTWNSWRIVAFPVYPVGKPSGPSGAVVLAKSTVPLNNEIQTLWLILGSVGVAAVLGATLMAVWLARWVSKPLLGLDTTARRLADGDLEIRARTGTGPPELRRLALTFNTMAGRLEALVHGSRAVVADVSHQLRTPLAALRLRLDLLAADAAETDPEMAAELAGAQDEVARLSRMVDGLLAVARAENVLPQPRAIDVADVATERVHAWLPVAEDRGIELIVTGSEVVGWLGEGHLEQVLDNLIANALDALSPGSRISVTVSHTDDGARITVADNGPGMSEEDRERAFLRFTSNSPGGTGLGLAIVHRLTTSNGGTARLAQTEGGGLTVTLDFPGPPTSEDPAKPTATAHHPVATAL